jgi:hypothetical protein
MKAIGHPRDPLSITRSFRPFGQTIPYRSSATEPDQSNNTSPLPAQRVKFGKLTNLARWADIPPLLTSDENPLDCLETVK